jgi:hypothetical protein
MGPTRRLHRQHGAFVIQIALALILFSLMTMALYKAAIQADDVAQAGHQGRALDALRRAAHNLVMDNYTAYQAGQAITVGGVTLPDGDQPGQSRHPTVANLRAMHLGVDGVLDSGIYKTLTQAQYEIAVTREPSGCLATAPAGANCRVEGTICLTRPLQDYDAQNEAIDSLGISALLATAGGDAGVSVPGSSSIIRAPDGHAIATNPIKGNPPGVVCAAFGWGLQGADYLRVRDPRDPQFMNNVTVAGNIATGTGQGTATTCNLVELIRTGQVITRAANCIRRAWMDGSTGSIGIADPAGQERASMSVTAQGDGQVTADRFSNRTGTASITPAGTIKAADAELAKASLGENVTLGSACTPDGRMGWGIQGAKWTLARCTNGIWASTGALREGMPGTTCGTVDGVAGVSVNGEQLICSGGSWIALTARMGRFAMMASYLVVNGDIVVKPSCPSGSLGSSATLSIGNEKQDNQYANHFLTDLGSTWQVTLASGIGRPITGDAIVSVYCAFP